LIFDFGRFVKTLAERINPALKVKSVFFILLLILQVNTIGLKKVNESLKIISKWV
jgi:hypothetical protein